MSFLAALFALILDQVFRQLEPLRDPRWFRAYAEAFIGLVRSSRPGRASAGVVLIVLVPAFAVLFVGDLLYHIWEGLGFVYAVVLFWFCLGPRDLHTQGQAYMEAVQAGDELKATQHATEILDAVPPAVPLERCLGC